ncbi:SlyX family protein [Chitinimonas sp. PSY-7]|uniref:SlyX family protein n=1 Tax=Chitinimonas sp. PSY-7 TaxID=3459088 RepID=UPI00403FC919
MEDRVTELEIRLALQDDLLDELNKVVARQQQQLEWLAQEMRSLTERMQDGFKPAGIQHEIPPHY